MRRVSKVKGVDDVMSGAAAWRNVDQTNGKWHLFVSCLPFARQISRSPYCVIVCCSSY